MQFLLEHVDTVFEYDYTKQMEDELDIISKGEKPWHSLCSECDTELEQALAQVQNDAKRLMIQVDDHHTYMIARFGPVLKYDNPETGKGS